MTTLLDLRIERTIDRYFASPEFKAKQRRWVRYIVQGFADGYKIADREAFTQTVADRIHARARSGSFKLFGVKLWKYRYSKAWCLEQAERIVTEWLRDEGIKFGDPRFFWGNGTAIADEEMSHWEAIP
jgi:hypothetical protein